jgi:hypothetical protein
MRVRSARSFSHILSEADERITLLQVPSHYFNRMRSTLCRCGEVYHRSINHSHLRVLYTVRAEIYVTGVVRSIYS